MMMIEFDAFELYELQKQKLPESMKQKIATAVKMYNDHENGIVFFNGATAGKVAHAKQLGSESETRRSTDRETRLPSR